MKLENLIGIRLKALRPPVFKETLTDKDGALLPEDKIVRYYEYNMIASYGYPLASKDDPLKLDSNMKFDLGNPRIFTCGVKTKLDQKTGKKLNEPAINFEVGVWYVPDGPTLDLLDVTKIKGLDKTVKTCAFAFDWVKEQ